MTVQTDDVARERAKHESKMYQIAAGALLVVLLCFGLLQLNGIIRV